MWEPSPQILSLLVTNCDSYPTNSALSVSNSGIGAAPPRPMTTKRDHIAESYYAVVALLESRIISPATRHQLEIFQAYLEKEIADELNNSGDIAAD